MTTHFPVIRAIESIMGLRPCSGSLQDMGGFYPAQADGNGAGNVFVADYRNFLGVAGSHQPSAFATFWGVTNDCTPTDTDSLFKRLEHTRCIVLIESPPAQAEGISRHPSKTEYAKHLRAADWALAYCARLAKGAATIATKTVAAPMVIVLDLYGAGDSDAAESFNVAGLSCLKVFSARNGLHHIDAFTTAIQKANEFKNVTVKTEDIKRLTRQWSSSLADASGDDDEIGRSHYLNNLLGPLALAVGLEPVGQLNGLRQWVTKSVAVGEDCDVAGRRALMNALEWNGRGSHKPDANLNLSSKKLNLASLPIPGRELRVLVLDDQIEHGWVPIIAHALGVPVPPAPVLLAGSFAKIGSNGALSLWVSKDPNSVKEDLNKKNGYRTGLPKYLRFTGTVSDDVEPSFDEILLLDLRLFGKQAASAAIGDAQKAFETWVKKNLNDQAEKWIENDQHGRNRLTALPRLISKRDYTYPVVIWSSTGQRHIIDSLREYKNIETGLRKPKFDTYGHDAAEFLSSFSEALTTAQRMNEARHWLSQSLAVPHSTQATNALFKGIQDQVSEFSHSTVYIFLDESGTDDKAEFKQGGLAIVVSSDEIDWQKHLDDLSAIWVDKKINLKNKRGNLIRNIPIASELKSEYFKGGSHAKANAITFYSEVKNSLLNASRDATKACLLPVALLDQGTNFGMLIDARNIAGIERLVLGVVATIVDCKKHLDVHLAVDSRRVPLNVSFDAEFEKMYSPWFDVDQVVGIKKIYDDSIKIEHFHSSSWNPTTRSDLSLQIKHDKSPQVSIMSSSVPPVVVHGVATSVLSRVNSKFKVSFVHAKSTYPGGSAAACVMRNVGDFVPRFAYPLCNPNALDDSFLTDESIVSHVQNSFSSKADRLLDVFFSKSPDLTAERALIQIAEILGRSNPAPQINSFESIAITRLYSEIEPVLRDAAFWNLARLLPLLLPEQGAFIMQPIRPVATRPM